MMTASAPNHGVRIPAFKPGQMVEVLSAREILATLDSDGKLDGVPFMPEMLPYCGRPFRISQRADVACHAGRPRKLDSTVYLDQLRCDGAAHHGCQAACRLLWKESWLRPISGTGIEFQPKDMARAQSLELESSRKRSIPFVWGSAVSSKCQAVELGTVGCPLFHSHQEYFRSLGLKMLTGKIKKRELTILAAYARGKLTLLAFTRWARAPWNRNRYNKTPAERLDLQAGEWVQVRSAREILRTLDARGCNRGMAFTPEMFQFCGGKFRVVGRVKRFIDEGTGTVRDFANECILLDSVYCHGQRVFCTRGTYHYWREIWLRRCAPEAARQEVPSARFAKLSVIAQQIAASLLFL